MTERLIVKNDPQPEVRKNAENAPDWEYAEEAKYLYRMAVLFKDRFLDPILLTDRRRLPDPVISFDNIRNYKVLAAYTLHRNPQGLLDEITFNTEQYDEVGGKQVWRFGRWAQLETLLHEQLHLWQQNFGEIPVIPGKTPHNKEFIKKAESLGLHPMPGVGCHVEIAGGPFEQLMKELGIERPEDVPQGDMDWFKILIDLLGKGKKGRSSLTKWECPECGMKVRMGIKGDPQLIHHPCSEKKGEPVFLVNAEGLVANAIMSSYGEVQENPSHSG